MSVNTRHVGGWLLIASGLILLWLWQNFRETFGGSFSLHWIEVETATVPFLAGVASLIGGALLARGGWAARVLHVPLKYVVGLLAAGVVASTARPVDLMARADTWVAFRVLRPTLDAISHEVPRGLTSMECDLQLGDQQDGTPDEGCKHIFDTRIKQRSPTEDSLYSAMVDAQVRGFYDIEMRRSHFALVRIVPSPGVRKGFLKMHLANNTEALPQQLFLHPVADIYPLGEGWFHFVTH